MEKLLSVLLIGFGGISCAVPPSCIDQTFGPPGRTYNYLAALTVYSEPIQGPVQMEYPAGIALWELFESGASVRIRANGSMAVSGLDMWPERCPMLSREELAVLSQSWQIVLDRMDTPHENLRVMAAPEMGDGWRPEGRLLSLSLSLPSGKRLSLLWDGQARLPDGLDAAVVTTLETVCSTSRLARKYLLGNLPQQVATRLNCKQKSIARSQL